MIYARIRHLRISITACLIAIFICVSIVSAIADVVMPKMPEPPSSPTYWQLARVDLWPEENPRDGYQIAYQTAGFSLDLSDGLMAESLLEKDESSYQPEVTFTVSKDGQALSHVYTWTALPVYLEKDGVYPITVKGREDESLGHMNSRLEPSILGEQQGRVSAGAYKESSDSLTFNITTDSLLRDGSILVSFDIRDIHGMFQLRADYTYEMRDGAKPKPTPFPGFLPVELAKGGAPEYYDEVEGVDGLWRVTTAPDEYRAYGSMNGGEARFYPADASGEVERNIAPADPSDDFMSHVQGFVATKPAQLPPHYHEISDGVYGFTSRDGEIITRAHGRVDGSQDAFYPMVGDPAVVSTIEGPVDPDLDYIDYIEGFGAATPGETVPHYQQNGNVYAFTGRDGVTQYRVFGRLNGAEPAYYPSTEEGIIIDETPVHPQQDFDTYIKGFDAVQPADIPSYYQAADNGVYTFTDRQGVPFYRVYGVLDGAQGAFYPSDALGNRIEGEPVASPDADFEAHIAGFDAAMPSQTPQFYEQTDVAGVWAFEDVDGQTQYRAYGSLNRGESAFYPSDAQGNVAADALPINPASDLLILPPPPVFSAAEPENPPSFYVPVPGQDGLYSFLNEDGDTVYRVFGGYDDQQPAFYPADFSGALLDDAEPVNIEDDQSILAKPPATPITFVVVTQSPTSTPAAQINRGVAPAPAATPYACRVAEADSVALERFSPLQRIITAPSSTPYAYTVRSLPAPTETSNPVTQRVYEAAPSPTPYAFEIVRDVSSEASAPVTVRAYVASPTSTPYAANVLPASTTAAKASESVHRQTANSNFPAATISALVLESAAPGETAGALQRQYDESNATPVAFTVSPTGGVEPSATEIVRQTAESSATPVTFTVSPTDGAEPPATEVVRQSAIVADVTITSPAEQSDATAVPSQSTDSVTNAETTPAGTGAPAETEAPDATDIPAETEAPDATDVPAETETPALTDNVDETATPADTDQESGSNSWLYLLFAALATGLGIGGAYLSKRKK